MVDSTAALERENAEKDEQINNLKAEIERLQGGVAELREALEREAKDLRQGNTEKEMKVRELERKVGVVEMKEAEERSKRVRAEEEMKEMVDEKEREIEVFMQQIEELEERLKEKTDLEEKVRILELSISENSEVNMQWPVVVGSSGLIVAIAALIHFCSRR